MLDSVLALSIYKIMKKIQFAKIICKQLLVTLIASAVIFSVIIPGYSWIKVQITAKQQEETSEQNSNPSVYAILLDTDPSMQVNFPNLGDSMEDRIKVCLCLLNPEDTLAVFSRNSEGGPVVFHGADDLSESVQRVSDIDFALESEKSSDGWIEEAIAFLSDHPDKRTQLQIITDKSMDELEGMGLTAQAADEIHIVTSGNNIVFDYFDNEVVFSSVRVATSGEAIAKDYTFNHHYLTDKSVSGSFHLNLKFPEKINNFVVVLSGDIYLANVHLSHSDALTTGFTLSNGDRVFFVEATPETESGYLLGSGVGEGTVTISSTYKQLKVWEDNFTLVSIIVPWILVLITLTAYLILTCVERKTGERDSDSMQVVDLNEEE